MTKPSLASRLLDNLPRSILRFLFNLWPPFRGAGIKVKAIAPDFRTFDVTLKLGLSNRNYAGVHFGGSLFAMIDPFFMLILAKNLGNDYIVWDKAAFIDFKKPGRGIIHARCSLSQEEINDIRQEADKLGKYVFDRRVDLFDEANEVVATVIKTLYVRHRTKDFKAKKSL